MAEPPLQSLIRDIRVKQSTLVVVVYLEKKQSTLVVVVYLEKKYMIVNEDDIGEILSCENLNFPDSY